MSRTHSVSVQVLPYGGLVSKLSSLIEKSCFQTNLFSIWYSLAPCPHSNLIWNWDNFRSSCVEGGAWWKVMGSWRGFAHAVLMIVSSNKIWWFHNSLTFPPTHTSVSPAALWQRCLLPLLPWLQVSWGLLSLAELWVNWTSFVYELSSLWYYLYSSVKMD